MTQAQDINSKFRNRNAKTHLCCTGEYPGVAEKYQSDKHCDMERSQEEQKLGCLEGPLHIFTMFYKY